MKIFFIILALGFSLETFGDISASKVNSIVDCDPTQKNQLLSAEKQISIRLAEVLGLWDQFDLEHVKTNFIFPEGRRFSEGASENDQYTAYWHKMKSHFEKMERATTEGIHLTCREDQTDRFCNKGQVLAYVRFSGNQALPMIYICTSFFSMPVEQQVNTVFHELSHYAAGTEDYAMDWWSKNSIDVLRAADDAYHLQNFSSGDIGPTLRRSIWLWLWPRASERF